VVGPCHFTVFGGIEFTIAQFIPNTVNVIETTYAIWFEAFTRGHGSRAARPHLLSDESLDDRLVAGRFLV
jgi:hypothetical protein